MRWDVFISHASEDKVGVAVPLAVSLQQHGLKVWLDRTELSLGDSLRSKIDQGLSQSRYGIVILSKAFFAKHWPLRELNGLVSRETEANKVVLPVWHGVDHGYISQYSAILADKLAVSTDDGLDKVVSAIIDVLRPSKNEKTNDSRHTLNSGSETPPTLELSGRRKQVSDVLVQAQPNPEPSPSEAETPRIIYPIIMIPLPSKPGLYSGYSGLFSGYVRPAFSADGAMCASAMDENSAGLWDLRTGNLIRVFPGHTSQVNAAAFSADASLLASGGTDGTLRLWRVEDGALLNVQEEHTASVTCLVFSPEGMILASGAADKTAKLWTLPDLRLLRTLRWKEVRRSSSLLFDHEPVTGIAFSRDGSLVAARRGSQDLLMWSSPEGKLLRTFDIYGKSGLAFSSDGTLLAAGSIKEVILLSVLDGKKLHTLAQHGSDVTALAFSKDSRLLASASEDRTVRLWNVQGHTLVHTLYGHTAQVGHVAFFEDGTLASHSADGSIRRWQLARHVE